MIGCVVGLKPTFTAITVVAIGTSLPDTFASMKAARDSETADAAIGNVTGSNAVNVFLGLGLPWVIACLDAQANKDKYLAGNKYVTPPGALGFTVILFLITSIICFITLIIRRNVSNF